MYVLNNTNSDLTYKFRGSVYVLLANRVAQINNSEISIADLKGAFGESSVTLLTSLTGAQEALLDSALKGPDVTLAIGEPADSANTDSTSTTSSLMANIKGLLKSFGNISTGDNFITRFGTRSDSANTDSTSTTSSLMANIKGLLSRLTTLVSATENNNGVIQHVVSQHESSFENRQRTGTLVTAGAPVASAVAITSATTVFTYTVPAGKILTLKNITAALLDIANTSNNAAFEVTIVTGTYGSVGSVTVVLSKTMTLNQSVDFNVDGLKVYPAGTVTVRGTATTTGVNVKAVGSMLGTLEQVA